MKSRVHPTYKTKYHVGNWPAYDRALVQRGWKKLHFAVDRAGVIVAGALTEPTVDDATTGIDLIEVVDDEIAVPPAKTAMVSRRWPRSRARDRTITHVKTLGRRRWKREAGYHRQARVENAFFRYKSMIGDRLRARSRGGRVAETVVACNVLNQMTELGRPESYSIGR